MTHRDVAFSRTRRTIAEHMTRSLQVSAQLTSIVEVDMTSLMQVRSARREAFCEATGISLTPLPFVALAAIETLRAFPQFNAHVLEDARTARIFDEVNLGIAVGRDEGLIVPVVHGAEMLSFAELARAIADVAERARTKGGLTLEDVSGGTFTLTNYGSFGAIMDTPIIAQPQVAILGIGAIQALPRFVGEDVQRREVASMSLTYDHRWIDGHQAARFNAALKSSLERDPAGWPAP